MKCKLCPLNGLTDLIYKKKKMGNLIKKEPPDRSGGLHFGLGLSGRAEIQRNRRLLRILDFAVSGFVSVQVLAHRLEQPFGMLRREYDPGLDFGLWRTRHDAHKVQHEF